MDLKNQKRMSSRILKVGKSRVWISPESLEDVAKAITGDDIRELIRKGVIKAKPKIGNSRGRIKKAKAQKSKGRRKGPGSKKGKQGTRTPGKESWMKKIRAQRSYLKSIKEKLMEGAYRELYRKASGGYFRSVSHMKLYIEKNGLVRREE